MIRKILTASVIAGIAVMLSMSALGTAYAERADAICAPAKNNPNIASRCTNIPEVADHIHAVFPKGGLCGGDVTDIIQVLPDTILLTFEVTHGAGPCEESIGGPIGFLISGTL